MKWLYALLSIVLVPAALAAPVDVHDGFESPELSKVWETSRFTPGAVEMQTNVVRAGHGAVKITVRSRDTFEAGRNGGKDSERDELLEAKKLVAQEGVACEQSFSMFFPTNFPIVPTRLVIAQWKQYCSGADKPCDNDSPIFKLRYVSGKLKFVHQTGPHDTTLFEMSDDLRGKWTEFRFQTRFTTGTNGFIKAWVNGKQVVDYTGVNAYPENAATGYASPSHFYFKMGLYRDMMPEPMTIYIDEYRKRQLPEVGH